MKKYKFNDVFKETVTLRGPTHINGTTFFGGVSLQKGDHFGGIDFFENKGCDIQGYKADGVFYIEGIHGFPAKNDIKEAAKDKFKAGEKDHPDQEWESVDHLSELKEELLDAYNYLQGLEKYNLAPDVGQIRKLIIEAYQLSGRLKNNKGVNNDILR